MVQRVRYKLARHCSVYMRVGVARALSDSSDLGLLEKQSSQKLLSFPASDADEPPSKI